MESLLADDFIITVEDGTTFSKTGYPAHTADSELRVQISVMSDIRVRMHGSIAIVTGAYHEKTHPRAGLTNTTTVSPTLDKHKGQVGWQVLASHYSIPTSQ